MRHIFRAQKLGWKKDEDIVWFDTKDYTKEEAASQFKPFAGLTQKGYPYTGYEFGGEKYHHFSYVGTCEDNKMPKTLSDILDLILHRNP